MLKAIRALGFKNSSRSLQDSGDDDEFGECLNPQNQFMLVIPRAEVDRPRKTNNFGLTRVSSRMMYKRPALSTISSLTTHSNTSSLGLTTKASDESNLSRGQDPTSFMDSLSTFTSRICGVVPLDDHNNTEGNAHCCNNLCFVNDEIGTTIAFGASEATSMSEAEESSSGTHSNQMDGDNMHLDKAEAREAQQIAPKGKVESREEAVLTSAPDKSLPSRKGRPQERKRELLQKLFRARREKKARAEKRVLDSRPPFLQARK